MKKNSEEDGWRGFLELCSKAKSPKELDALLGLFLTLKEREDLSARYWIVRELISGERTQREIAEERHVSIAQITRGSNALKIIGQDLRRLLES